MTLVIVYSTLFPRQSFFVIHDKSASLNFMNIRNVSIINNRKITTLTAASIDLLSPIPEVFNSMSIFMYFFPDPILSFLLCSFRHYRTNRRLHFSICTNNVLSN